MSQYSVQLSISTCCPSSRQASRLFRDRGLGQLGSDASLLIEASRFGSCPRFDCRHLIRSEQHGIACSNSMDQCILFRMWTTTMYMGPEHHRTIAAKGLGRQHWNLGAAIHFQSRSFPPRGPFLYPSCLSHPPTLSPSPTFATFESISHIPTHSSTASTIPSLHICTYIVRLTVLPWCLIHTSAIPANPLPRRSSLPSLNGPPRLTSRPDCSRLRGQLVLLCTQ